MTSLSGTRCVSAGSDWLRPDGKWHNSVCSTENTKVKNYFDVGTGWATTLEWMAAILDSAYIAYLMWK